jgi:hypothetical protein
VLGELATGAKIVQAAAKGFGALKRLQPEYGRFWRNFESRVQPESRDLPWEKIEQLRLDPDFVGAACGLIRGDHEKRKLMRRQIAALATPPEGGRYDAAEIIERVMQAADESAVAAAHDERAVSAQRSRLLEGRLDELEANLDRQFEELRKELTAIQPEPRRPKRRPRAARPRADEPRSGRTAGESAATAPREDMRTAEVKLDEILARDDEVVSFLTSADLQMDQPRYRPDFVVSEGTAGNWLVEIKSDSALERMKRQGQLREMGQRVFEASERLSAEWHQLLLTPAQLQAASSWAEVKAVGLDPLEL